MIQMMLSVAAMVLLGVAILSMNSAFERNNAVMSSSKVGVIATSLAMSKIEEAAGKSFDAGTIDSLLSTMTPLTIASKLGCEAGDVYPFFDDLDDYNNLTVKDTIDGGGTLNKIPFVTTCKVCYVLPATPDLVQLIPTWSKKITVMVASPAMSDTVKQEFVYSYFHFQ